jgi:branched-chain amino acid transport system substrate-binding protein
LKKVLLVFLILNFVLVSCGRKEIIVVGIAEDTSTNLKDITQSLNNGRNLAISEINSSKDFPYNIKLKIIDTMDSPEKTANAFRVLCDLQDADILFGVPSVKCAQVAKHIANLRGKPFITEAFDEKVVKNVENTLLFNQNPYSEGNLSALYFFYVLKKNRLAILYDDSVPSFISIAKGFQEISKIGASVALESFSNSVQPIDFSAHFARLKEINPEVIFILSDAGLYLEMLKIAKEALKINAIFALNNLPKSSLNEPVFEGVYIILPFFEKKDKFVNSLFFKNYSAKFGSEPNLYSALGYDEMMLLKQILTDLKQVSFDSSLAAKLKGLKFEKEKFCTSFLGFDKNGLAKRPIDILKILGGNITYSSEFWMDYTGYNF